MILIVCHANTCCSPLAEAVMRDEGLEEVTSAALKNYDPAFKMPGVTKKVREWTLVNGGYDLSKHRARLLTPEMLREARLVLYMDSANLERLKSSWPEKDLGPIEEKTEPLGHYCTPPVERIADPVFIAKDNSRFGETLAQIVEAAKAFVERRTVPVDDGAAS